jgi:hypothetical protein
MQYTTCDDHPLLASFIPPSSRLPRLGNEMKRHATLCSHYDDFRTISLIEKVSQKEKHKKTSIREIGVMQGREQPRAADA